MLFDLKTLRSALEQMEEEKGISKEKILEAIEMSLAAAYKKEYGKKGQIVRAKFDMDSGATDFSQVKIVVDESIVKMPAPLDENGEPIEEEKDENDLRTRFNSEHHILVEDAKKIKRGAEVEDEIVFPLETKEDFGRIAAQTAKQVIIQKIREAEKSTTMDEFGKKEGEIVNGMVQRIEKGNIFVDLGKTTAILPYEEQISREKYRQGERIKAFLYRVEDTPRGINLRLSRTHPKLIEEFFKMEAPEVMSGVVEIKNIAREPGSRSKIAVYSNDEHIDPIGSCVGQRGVRVTTVMSELGGEKIDIIEWSEDAKKFISEALAPAKIQSVELRPEEKRASVIVAEDQLSLAIGKGGQNARLAAKLTGWKIDIHSTKETEDAIEEEEKEIEEEKEVKEFEESTGETPNEEVITEKEVVEEVLKGEVESATEEETKEEPKKTRKKKEEKTEE
ncbi:MAG: transcription termination factor NusA [Candidatus Parcubacteria bacterium]|nr:transcription termination factor NusA [Candidatus Parcubacteria bacterium]